MTIAVDLGRKATQPTNQHFCQLRKQHDDPVLTLYGSRIPVVQEYKYLGLIFDKS